MSPLAAICLVAAAPSPDGPDDVPAVRWPVLPAVAANAAGFAPPGWTVETAIVADLDGEGAPDVVAVLKGADPGCRVSRESGEPFDTNPRLLLVARAAAGGYRLALTNRRAILRVDDPYLNDPFDMEDGLAVAKRVIRLKLNFWRSAGGWATWGTALSFRWDGRRFAMIGADRQELRRNTGETETVSANYLTGRMRVDTGTIESDGTRTRWLRLPPRRPPALEAIGDALEYDPRR